MSATAPFQTESLEIAGRRFETLTAGDASSRKLALLLHGFPEHAISWRHQMPLLADLGYRVWAPNQRGYGHSHRPPNIEDYALAHLVDDVGALIDVSGHGDMIPKQLTNCGGTHRWWWWWWWW